MRRAERRAARSAAARATRARRPNGCASPRAPPPARAAAGCRAAAARASSCPVPGGPASSRLCRPPRRSRARAAPARARAPRPGRGARTSGACPFALLPARARVSPRRYATASAEVPNGNRLDAGERRLRRHVLGAEQLVDRRARRTLRDGEHAADAAQPTVEAELADRRVLARDARPGSAAMRRGSRARSAGRTPEPSLRSCAGARLTVMRRSGHSSSADATPLRMRCFASCTARSTRPTIAKPGMPLWM